MDPQIGAQINLCPIKMCTQGPQQRRWREDIDHQGALHHAEVSNTCQTSGPELIRCQMLFRNHMLFQKILNSIISVTLCNVDTCIYFEFLSQGSL